MSILSIPPKAVTLQHNADPSAHETLERRTAHVANNAETTVSLTLSPNTIYTYTLPISSISLTVGAGFTYAGVNFFCGSTAAVFTSPVTWIFNGDDCTPANIFIPMPNSRYRFAVEAVGEDILCDVQKYGSVTS